MLLMILKKIFFKLMINSVYGKTMENLRKRINVRLVNNEKDFLKYTSRPTHITHKPFGKDYAAINEIKTVLILNKPIYIGINVLDLGKRNMYDFHCNFVKMNFDAELLFTDTDSLSYEIKSRYQYKIFMKNFLSGKNYLTLVIFQKIQSLLMRLIKKLLVK